MSLLGWIFMLISWCVIIGLCTFCFGRIFRLQREHLVAPLEIDTEPSEGESETSEGDKGSPDG
jgi:hypothetical protein